MSVTPPRLTLKHSPGFTLRQDDDGVLIVFESTQEEFGMDYEIDLWANGKTSSSLQPTMGEILSDPTSDDLADLANQTDLLQAWLDDCAEVLYHVRQHRSDYQRLITPEATHA